MYLISAEGYKNARIHILITKKSDEIWVSMKNLHKGLGVKNMSDPILKEIYIEFMKQKTLLKSKFKNAT